MPNGNHTSGMAPDQVVSIIRNSHKFKQDIDRIIKEQVPEMIETVIGNMVPHLIEVAVLKGQLELVSTIKTEMDTSFEKGYTWVLRQMWRKIEHELKQQLDHAATTEKYTGEEVAEFEEPVKPSMREIMDIMNEPGTADALLDDSPAVKYFTEKDHD